MKRPVGVTVVAVFALCAAGLYAASAILAGIGADLDIVVLSLATSLVSVVVFLLVGVGFLAGYAWAWALAFLLIGWHVALQVLGFLTSLLDGHLSLGVLLAMAGGLLVTIAIAAAVGLYLARGRVQGYFGVYLRGESIAGVVAAAAVIAVVTRGLPYLSL